MIQQFRAWLKHINKMVDVLSINFQNEEILYKIDNDFCNADDGTSLVKGVAPFKYIELMQFTGLYDKNGTEIYEGDIAKLPSYLTDNTEYAICKWIDNRFSVEDVIGFSFVDTNGKRVKSDEWEDFEIIGNIYENKEMIE